MSKPGRTIMVDGPAADTLFQRLPIARENERRMRAEQARRDERAAFARTIERQRRRRALVTGVARNVGAVVLLVAMGLVLLARLQLGVVR